MRPNDRFEVRYHTSVVPLPQLFRPGLIAVMLAASMVGAGDQGETRERRLPNGKLQQEELLKLDHQKNLQDAAALIDLSEQLKQELEKNGSHVLSLSSLKKTDEIEKLAKRIRSRLRRN